MSKIVNIDFCTDCARHWPISRSTLHPNFEQHKQDIKKIIENHLEGDPPAANDDLQILQDQIRKGEYDTRIVYLSKSKKRVYKFEVMIDQTSGNLMPLGHCYAGANETRLNDIYRSIYNGFYAWYATVAHVKVTLDDGTILNVFDTPFIQGVTPTIEQFNSLIIPFAREINSRLRLFSMDNKPENFKVTPQGQLLPIDAKFIASKRSSSPRSKAFGTTTTFHQQDITPNNFALLQQINGESGPVDNAMKAASNVRWTARYKLDEMRQQYNQGVGQDIEFMAKFIKWKLTGRE